jgi:hypothetical protein
MSATTMLPHKIATNEEIEAAMAHELSALSLKVRTDVLEEIHCVKSMAVQETPILVDDGIEKLRRQVISLGGCAGRNDCSDALDIDTPYVKSRDFGLKFLRADFFNVNLAARRMVTHLELLFKFYGPLALQRPLRFSDLTKKERFCIRKGVLQILPSRDKAGRLILVFQGSMDQVTNIHRVRHTCQTKG